MPPPLRVLIIEDSEPDALLLLRQLRQGGFELKPQRVETLAALGTALAAEHWDVIIADYRLPKFTGLDALKLVQTTGRDVPFILVSGAIGEEQAAAVMKAGAHDFLLKDRLAQLAPAVERELKDAKERRQRKQTEEELLQLNRIQHALSGSIHALLHATTERELLNDICRIITESCGHVMVWIGFAEEDPDKSVRPVACAGFEDGYLETLQISWADTERGRGPAGTAIRAGKPCRCNDILKDPAFEPWRTEALRRGYASTLTLPLLDDLKAFGVICIYSRMVAGFSENEVKLLSDLADELAYGILTLRSREARLQAEAALRRSEQFALGQWAEAEGALEAIPANIAILDADGMILRVNKAWTSFTNENGIALGWVAVGVNYLDLCEEMNGAEARHARTFASGIRSVIRRERESFSIEYPCHSEEEQHWFIGYVTPAPGDGTARAVIAHVDITARKLIEDQIINLNHELESRVTERTSELRAAVDALEAQIAERQRLESEILRICEHEQSRIGQDLHDGACQDMACVAVLADVVARDPDLEKPQIRARLQEISQLSRQSVDEVRRLAAGLFPVKIEQQGLEWALHDLASTTSERGQAKCTFTLREPMSVTNQNAAIQLYRIAQEAVSNALRHGHARNITMELAAKDGTVSLSICDDGSGMPNSPKKSGLGLHTMEYRARVLGGFLEVCTEAGRGTTVICSFPEKEFLHAQANT